MIQVKEKAPVKSGNSDEGITPNDTKGMILSNSLTQDTGVSINGDASQLTVSQIKQLADEAGVKPSVFWNQSIQPEPPNEFPFTFNYKEPSASEVAYAERFLEYKVVIDYVSDAAVKHEGKFRFFGGLVVIPSRKQIQIRLFAGATSVDLQILEQDVKKIREGYWSTFPWSRETGKMTGVEYFRVCLGNELPEKGDRIFPCSEERCTEFGGHHLLDRVDPTDTPIHYGDVMRGENYRLQLIQEQGVWQVDGETYRPLSPAESASYASDLMWLAAEAKKLNNVQGDQQKATSHVAQQV